MTDPLDSLEKELRQMKPREFPRALNDAIEVQLAEQTRWSWADRCLVGAMSAGALAACVIVGLVLAGSWTVPARPTTPIADVQTPRLGDRPVLLAGADFQFINESK
jgi:hypothetical protein